MKSLKTQRKRFAAIIFSILFFIGFTNIKAANIEKIEKQVTRNIGIISDNKVDVTVEEDGTVILEGTVETLYNKMAKHQAVSKVDGVNFIKNQIVVDATETPARLIEYNIKKDLRKNIHERPKNITVKVNDEGIVFLSGEVKNEKEKITAESVAAWQKGVKVVVNTIKVST